MSHVEVHAVTKSYRQEAVLRGVELEVPAARVTAILGRTGCGKTTLLRIIAGFLRPDGGEIRIGGQLMYGGPAPVPPERRRVGYVAQDGGLFPHLTVAGNVGFGVRRRQRRRTVESMLELVGLPATYARRHPHELSGGEQQRVALARALAPRPDVILLDEPFAALDPGSRAETRQSVVRALGAARITAVLITHDQAEALSTADQVAVLRDGVIAQAGPPASLYRRPVDADLAAFLGEAVLIPGDVSGTTATCVLGRLAVVRDPLPRPGAALLMIRPEQVRWHHTLDGSSAVSARVVRTAYYGYEVLVHFTVDATDQPTTVRARAHADIPPRPDDELWLTVAGPVVAYPV